jgi:hypothetical protein
MNTHSQVLIELCHFVDPETKRRTLGSLHQILDILIFDGSGHPWIDATESPMPEDEMGIMAKVCHAQGAMLVIPLAFAEFNSPAFKFLTSKMKAEESQIITFGENVRH